MAEAVAQFPGLTEYAGLLHSFHMLSTEVGSEDRAVPWKTVLQAQLTA
jgi:hypothetical protein